MSLAVSDEGLRPSARDEDLRRAEKHRLLPHCLYEILYQYTACAAVCQPRRAHFSKLFFAWSATSAVCRSGALRRFTAVCQPRSVAASPFVGRRVAALYRRLSTESVAALHCRRQARALRRRETKKDGYALAFLQKKARARAKFGWCVLVAVRQKAALFEEAGDIV